MKQRVSVIAQMLGSHRCCHPGTCLSNKIHGSLRGDVFKNHAQIRKTFQQRDQLSLDEYGLTVKNIYARVGHFTMDLQRHPGFCQSLQHPLTTHQVAHSRL
ncbi:MAG: hypothetical protein WJ310_11990 [Ferrovum myxofaciens]